MTRPDCFDTEEQWIAWCFAADQMGAQISHGKFCVDCLPEYRDKMIEAGRCSYPETVFVIERGAIFGIHSSERGWYGAVTGCHSNSGKKSTREVIAIGSPMAVINEIRRRKAG